MKQSLLLLVLVLSAQVYGQQIWDEESLKAHWDANGADEFEGIYEKTFKSDGAARYKLALVKTNSEYTLFYLSGALPERKELWQTGDIKAQFEEETSRPGVYKVIWYMGSKKRNRNVYIKLEKNKMRVIWAETKHKDLYYKMYPQTE